MWKNMKRTKVVCTIGPSTNSYEKIKELVVSGMNVARLNMSHGSIAEHQKTLDIVKRVRKELGVPCAIMVDTCGPEMRIGTFENGKVLLEKGKTFVLSTKKIAGNEKGVYFGFPKLLSKLRPKQKIYANNGLIELTISKIEKENIVCKVSIGGVISNHKSVSIPHTKLSLPFISEQDKNNISFAVKNDVEYISASFVSCKKDVEKIKDLVSSMGGRQRIISKIENQEGLDNLQEITLCSDGIMVARGDLGTEIPLEKIPVVQKNMIKTAILNGKFVVVATEMLESMTSKPRPTRAETTDVAQAIYDKTCATMLSGETASGEYPILSCSVMSNIATTAENSIDYNAELLSFPSCESQNVDIISYSACIASKNAQAKAIVCFTDNGHTAESLSKFRPTARIIALTHDDFTFNSLSLVWGITPIKVPKQKTFEKMIKTAKDIVKKLKIAKNGDKIILTLGLPLNGKEPTNTINICDVD